MAVRKTKRAASRKGNVIATRDIKKHKFTSKRKLVAVGRKKPAARGMKWWKSLTKKQQMAYLKAHPNSKFGGKQKGKKVDVAKARSKEKSAYKTYTTALGKSLEAFNTFMDAKRAKTLTKTKLAKLEARYKKLSKDTNAKNSRYKEAVAERKKMQHGNKTTVTRGGHSVSIKTGRFLKRR